MNYRTKESAAPGPDYVCSKCGARELRLWRHSNVFSNDVELFCATCAAGDQKKQIAEYADFHRDTDCTIGDLVPARPTPDGDTFWGHTSGDVEWWYALPQYADVYAEIALLRRERDHFVIQLELYRKIVLRKSSEEKQG